MRDIRFRVWDIDLKEMVPSHSTYWRIECNGDGSLELTRENFNGYIPVEGEFMQYTGMNDKNGVPIYEGDILGHPLQGKRVVEYGGVANLAAYSLKSNQGALNTLQDASRLYEIVGNVFENPELLED